MKHLLVILLLAAASSALAQVQPRHTNEQQIRQIANEFRNKYDNKDPAGIAALYAEDGYYVSQHVNGGIIQGREAIRANAQRGIDGGGFIDSIEIAKLEIAGQFAYAVGSYHATNSGQRVTGRNIIVFKKIHGKWLIVAHTSVVPEQP